jgi:two-component sensor histidine kinase
LKYAFQGRDEGVIQLSLSEMNDTILLSIKDDGVGLPKDFNYEKTNSLGIQLVYALIEQLDATMDIRREEGTEFKISFKRR